MPPDAVAEIFELPPLQSIGVDVIKALIPEGSSILALVVNVAAQLLASVTVIVTL